MARYHVMIVDDEKMICSVLADYLQEYDFVVTPAHSLNEARNTLNTLTTLPQAIVLDIMLPDGNGVDFLRELRKDPRTKSLPIVMITAHRVSVKDRIMGFDDGADDYLLKPFDLSEFRSRIQRLIRRTGEIRSQG